MVEVSTVRTSATTSEIGNSLEIVSGAYLATFALSPHFLSRLRERFYPDGFPHPRDLRHSLKSSLIVDDRHGTVGLILKHRLTKSIYLVNTKDDAIYVLEQSNDGRFRTLRTCYRRSSSDWIADAVRQARKRRTGKVADRIAEGAENGIFDVQPIGGDPQTARTWRLSASYRAANGNWKMTNLGSMTPLGPSPRDLTPELRADLFEIIWRRLADKAILEAQVVEVLVRTGKKGDPIGIWSDRWKNGNATGT